MTDAFDYDKLPTGPDGRKHCKTRDGRDVTIVCNDAPGDYPIRGWFECDGIPLIRRKNGGYSIVIEGPDLVMPSRKCWVNLCGRGGGMGSRWWPYETREEADRAAGPDRVACVEVEL